MKKIILGLFLASLIPLHFSFALLVAGGAGCAMCSTSESQQYKEPAVIEEKQTELKNKIAQANDLVKSVQAKLIDRYEPSLSEIDSLIKDKQASFLTESDSSAQLRISKEISCLEGVRRELDFKQSGAFSNFNEYFYRFDLYHGRDTILSRGICSGMTEEAAILGKVTEMFAYKNSLTKEYNLDVLIPEIKNLMKVLNSYTEILKDERTPYCSSWNYSDWGQCLNGQQTRFVVSSYPDHCIDGTPILTQRCNTPVSASPRMVTPVPVADSGGENSNLKAQLDQLRAQMSARHNQGPIIAPVAVSIKAPTQKPIVKAVVAVREPLAVKVLKKEIENPKKEVTVSTSSDKKATTTYIIKTKGFWARIGSWFGF